MLLLGALVTPLACGGDDADGEPVAPTLDATVAPPATEPTALTLPSGVTVFVEFPRYLHAARRLEVAFDNQSDSELTVTELVLRSPLFEPVAPDPRQTIVEVGRRRDLQIGLGAALCPAPSGPSEVEVTAEIGGQRQHGLVAIDPAPLDRISADECGRQFVLEQVGIGYAGVPAVVDGVVETSIELRRLAGDEPITATAVRGSVLLELRPATAADPLAALPGDVDQASFPVRIRVSRCDPHAVIESKKTFELSIWVSIGDREPQRIVVTPEGELRAVLEGLIQDCLRAQSS